MLGALAAGFEERHGDRWLRDVLAARRSETLVAGLAALAEAVQANLADESDRALEKAGQAASDFRAAGNDAGALARGVRTDLRASPQRAVSRRMCGEGCCLGTQSGNDELHLDSRTGDSRGRKLPFAPGRFRRGAPRHDPRPHAGSRRWLRRPRIAGGRHSGRRADGSRELVGRLEPRPGGLATYWSGSYPGNRAQQIYFNLMRSAESLGLRQAAYVFERAAATGYRRDPAPPHGGDDEGASRRLAVEAGRAGEARTEFEQAGRLFDRLQQASDREYRTFAELSRAQAELAAGAPQAAVKRLEAIRPSAEGGRCGAGSDQLPAASRRFTPAYWQAGRGGGSLPASDRLERASPGYAPGVPGARPTHAGHGQIVSRSRRAFVGARGSGWGTSPLGMVSSRRRAGAAERAGPRPAAHRTPTRVLSDLRGIAWRPRGMAVRRSRDRGPAPRRQAGRNGDRGLPFPPGVRGTDVGPPGAPTRCEAAIRLAGSADWPSPRSGENAGNRTRWRGRSDSDRRR